MIKEAARLFRARNARSYRASRTEQLPIAGGAGVGIVQYTAESEVGTATTSVRLPSYPTTTTNHNSILVLCVLYSNDGGSNEIDMAATNPVVDDATGGSNTYAPIAQAEVKRAATNWYQHTYWFLCQDAAPALNFTANFSRTTWNFISVYELTPCRPDPVTPGITGQGNNGATGSSFSIDIGSVTPAKDGALAIFEIQHDGDNSVGGINLSLGSSWTQDRFDSAGGGQDTVGHQAQTTRAPIDFNGTGASGGPQNWSASGIILVTPGSNVTASVSMQATASLHTAGFRKRTARAAMRAVVTATFRGTVTHPPTSQFPVHTNLQITKGTDTAFTTARSVDAALQARRALNTTLDISGSS